MRHFFALSLTCAAMAAQLDTKAAVWRVNNQGYSADYTDLQVAIDDTSNVLSGDTLHVEASPVEYGDITMNRPLVLLGPGYFLSENSPVQANLLTAHLSRLIIEQGADGTFVSGLECGVSGFTYGIEIRTGNVTISRCLLTYDLRLNSVGAIQNVLITQCFINDRLLHGTNAGPVADLLILNNYIGQDLSLKPTAQGTVAQNVVNSPSVHGVNFYNNIVPDGVMTQNNNTASNVYNNIFGTALPAWLAGSTNYAAVMSDVFVTSLSPDAAFVTQAGCVDCANGFNGHVIGMYGGAVPYLISGIPAIPTIYLLQAPGMAVEGDSLNVTLSTRTNN